MGYLHFEGHWAGSVVCLDLIERAEWGIDLIELENMGDMVDWADDLYLVD